MANPRLSFALGYILIFQVCMSFVLFICRWEFACNFYIQYKMLRDTLIHLHRTLTTSRAKHRTVVRTVLLAMRVVPQISSRDIWCTVAQTLSQVRTTRQPYFIEQTSILHFTHISLTAYTTNKIYRLIAVLHIFIQRCTFHKWLFLLFLISTQVLLMCGPTLNHKLLQFHFHALWVGIFSLQVCEHEVYRQAVTCWVSGWVVIRILT